MRNPWITHLFRRRDGKWIQVVFPSMARAEEFCRQRLVAGITGSILRRQDRRLTKIYFFHHGQLHVRDIVRHTELARAADGEFRACHCRKERRP